jgi:predicted dehydrogenase
MSTSDARKRYALVGTGGRATMFLDAVADTFRDHAQLVGLCDVSPTRMAWHNRRIGGLYRHAPVPQFRADEFERMIRDARPHVVIVTTVDGTHHDYIVRAMDLGCDVICEKPMTIDAPKARAIFNAIERTGRKLRVTFNYRYTPHAGAVRELVRSGAVGRPLSVEFTWLLDTSHGADYFRRWHREKGKSGGLLVHKASHHFDLVNWWIDSRPARVFAMGELKFYGRANAEARGERYSYHRYTGQPEAARDPFALMLDRGASDPNSVYSTDSLRGLYLEAEADSGYLRDRNVFGEPIDAEDTMAVVARYRSGVIMNYSLLAYSPWEGFRVAITGDKGRIELFDKHGSTLIKGQGDAELAESESQGHEQSLRVFPMFGRPRDVHVERVAGGHGGGDPIMLRDIFLPDPPPDPLGRAASHIDGAAAIVLGISANESIATGVSVDCDKLIPLP